MVTEDNVISNYTMQTSTIESVDDVKDQLSTQYYAGNYRESRSIR